MLKMHPHHPATSHGGRLSGVILPAIADPLDGGQLANPHYQYGYDALGRQTSITDPLGRVTQFTYDAQGRQLTRTLPAGQTEENRYNDLGQLVLHVDFEGHVVEYIYDNAAGAGGRLAEKRLFDNLTAYDNGQGTPAETVQYTYDAFGRLVHLVDSLTGSTTYAYDAEGRTTQIASPEGIVNYAYDALGRKVRTFTGDPADPDNDTRYTYNALGRLATVTVWERNNVLLPEAERETTRYAYDLLGNLDEVYLPNGMISDYQYDSLNRLTELKQLAPDATPDDLTDNPPLADYAYDLLPDGRRSGVTETVWENGTTEVSRTDWQYDDLNRLIDEAFHSPDGLLDYDAHYTYDLTGSRLEKTVDQGNDGTIDETISSTYDQNDRLLTETDDLAQGTDTTTTHAYGPGNTWTVESGKTVVETAGGAVVQTTAYSYDLQGRLAGAVIEKYQDGQVIRRETAGYTYNDNGLRTTATSTVEVDADGDPSTLEIQSRSATTYLLDPQNPTGYAQVLEETTTDLTTGTVVKQIVYTLGLDVIAQTEIVPGSGEGGSPLYFVYDGHGSTRFLTTAAGTIAIVNGIPQIYWYDAYGNAVGFDPSTAATTLLYSGEQFDARLQMQYLRARYYDPATGRFNGLDPFSGNFGAPQSLHKYLYTHEDPVNGIDPSWLAESSIGGALSAMAIGGLVSGTIGSGLTYAKTRSVDAAASAFIYDFALGAATSGALCGASWAWRSYQSARAAQAAVQGGAALLPAALRLPQFLKDLPLTQQIVSYGGQYFIAGYKFISNKWQLQALIEYLEQVHAKYLQYSLNHAVLQSADDVILNTAGQPCLGMANPFARTILLSAKSNLGTLAEELIHFQQLSAKGLWGLANTAENQAILNGLKKTLEADVKSALQLWWFNVF
jgi:RHS repeat-associated protein